jgi:hypothetical protein
MLHRCSPVCGSSYQIEHQKKKRLCPALLYEGRHISRLNFMCTSNALASTIARPCTTCTQQLGGLVHVCRPRQHDRGPEELPNLRILMVRSSFFMKNQCLWSINSSPTLHVCDACRLDKYNKNECPKCLAPLTGGGAVARRAPGEVGQSRDAGGEHGTVLACHAFIMLPATCLHAHQVSTYKAKASDAGESSSGECSKVRRRQ